MFKDVVFNIIIIAKIIDYRYLYKVTVSLVRILKKTLLKKILVNIIMINRCVVFCCF